MLHENNTDHVFPDFFNGLLGLPGWSLQDPVQNDVRCLVVSLFQGSSIRVLGKNIVVVLQSEEHDRHEGGVDFAKQPPSNPSFESR